MRHKKGVVNRNYEIHANPSQVKEPNYVIIATGRSPHKNINENSIFMDRGTFRVIEGIFKKHYTKYDKYEMKNISRTTGMKIVKNLRESAEKTLSCKEQDILKVLEYQTDKTPKTINDFIKNRAPISKMLNGVADHIETAYEADEWICVSEGGPLTVQAR